MKFIAYYRVSTDRQGRSGLGLEAQQARVREHVAAVEGSIAGEFTEIESGRSVTRPQLHAAIAAAAAAGGTLIVAKLDRLARNMGHFLKIIDSGIPVTFCDLPQVPDGAFGRFMLQQIALIAELEVGVIRDRTRAALQAAKARGTKLGTHGLVLARRRRKEARDRAREIKGVCESQFGVDITQLPARAVAELLNQHEIRTHQGRPWSRSLTQRMLERLRTAD